MRVAVLSYPHERAATYVRLLRATPGVDLLTADPDDPARGRAMARRLDVPYSDDPDAVFARRPDAVLITSEGARRRELVERAAGIGARVLCEHPLAVEETDAEHMVRACAEAGVRLALASPACFSPAFVGMRHRLAAGELVGGLTTIHGAHTSPGRGPEWGALGTNAPALLDLVDAVLGGERADQVYAQSNSVLGAEPEFESAAVLTVRYPSGTVASLDCSQHLPGDRSAGGPTMTFVGDRASVEFQAAPRLLDGFDAATAGQRRDVGGSDPCAAMLDDFLATSGDERGNGPDGAAGVRALRVVRAAYASIRTGQPVDLPVPSPTRA